MSDSFFDADAHNPDHWRYYGRKAFAAECDDVLKSGPGAMTIGDVRSKALANLKARNFPKAATPNQTGEVERT